MEISTENYFKAIKKLKLGSQCNYVFFFYSQKRAASVMDFHTALIKINDRSRNKKSSVLTSLKKFYWAAAIESANVMHCWVHRMFSFSFSHDCRCVLMASDSFSRMFRVLFVMEIMDISGFSQQIFFVYKLSWMILVPKLSQA